MDAGERTEYVNPSEFKRNKLINEAARNWDIFYKHNTTNFFKDRHWTDREFPELRETGAEPNSRKLLEVAPAYDETRCKAFVNDLTKDALTATIPENTLDIISCIFVLSAIPPHKFASAIANLKSVLKPGGIILFRDYGLHDAAQLRFKAENRIDDRFYTRSDGTFSYYFTIEELRALFEGGDEGDSGFVVLESEYVRKEVVNRKQDLHMDRVFLQAKIMKK
eukprot:jgi/Hompol1/5485/HPOL_001985-RA